MGDVISKEIDRLESTNHELESKLRILDEKTKEEYDSKYRDQITDYEERIANSNDQHKAQLEEQKLKFDEKLEQQRVHTEKTHATEIKEYKKAIDEYGSR